LSSRYGSFAENGGQYFVLQSTQYIIITQ